MTRALDTADRHVLAIAAIVLAVLFFLALNMLAQATLTSARLDLTEDRRFTLSPGTRDLLAGIDEPIELKLYYSQALGRAAPAYGDHARRVGELLDAYARASQGRVRVRRFDPLPFSPEEDQAVAEGLRGVPLDAEGTLAYFGLVGSNSTDDLDTLAFLAPERAPFLEYELTRLVHNLANPEKSVVGVLGDMPLNGSQFDGFRPAAVTEAIGAFFEVRPVAVPVDRLDDVDLLLLAQPETLDDRTRYAIDQFVMAGGAVLAFVDPFAEEIARTQRGVGPQVPGTGAIAALTPLFEAWGVDVLPGQVVGDGVSAQRVAAQVRGRQVVADYLPWLGLGPANMDAQDAVTGSVELLQLRSAGAIVARDGAATTLTPLVRSSAQAALIDLIDIQFAPDPTRLLAEFQPTGERYVLAARVTGPITSAFPDGPPDGIDGADHKGTAEAPLNLVLVADADMLADASWVQRQALLGQDFAVPIADNGDFAINALDNLRGGASLATLRGRGVARRPFEVVESMRRKAELRYRATEQELLNRIDELEAEIRAIQADEADAGLLLTAAQQQVIDDSRDEMLALRGELRGVQHALRKDVARLESWIRLIDIWAVPLTVALFAVGLALLRRRHIRRDVAAGLA